MTCLSCGAAVPAGIPSCPSCGAPTHDGAGSITAALPRPGAGAEPSPRTTSADPLARLQTAEVRGERKPVTALFADVVDSTRLAGSLDPEDWVAVINRALQLMSEAVGRYEGTVARLAGDGVLALFGAETAHEDDPERAVRSALDMIDAIREESAALRQALGIELAIRVGICTGPAVVGEVGGELRHERTAMGDAVNLAARLQGLAPPGGVVVAADTHDLVAGAVETRDLGLLEVKGKTEPVHAFQVVGLRPQPGPRRLAHTTAAALVGRQEELARLHQALLAARSGRGRAALLLGEPGIGKSRLMEELAQRARHDGLEASWAVGRCLSYGQQLPYHLLLDLVRQIVGIPPAADPATARDVLQTRLTALLGSDAPLAELGHLLGLPLDPEPARRLASLDPSVLQTRYLDALRRLLTAWAVNGTGVLVCEDVHWADPSSVAVLIRLLPVVEQSPLLLVCTSRPERQVPGWDLIEALRTHFGDALVELPLLALSADAGRELLRQLLDMDHPPPVLEQLVEARAEGNPLFVEELVRMLVDRGALEADGSRGSLRDDLASEVPQTLHGLLVARLDRLPDEARRTLRVASVIGRRFPVRLLEEVLSHLDGAPTAELTLAEAEGLVRRGAVQPEEEYAFRHALIQEAAEASLLRRERRTLHRLVAEALERLEPERRGELAPELARHYAEAGELSRAAEFYEVAGRRALQGYANPEARQFLERAVALLPLDSTLDRRAEVLLGLGEARRRTADPQGAKESFADAAALAREARDGQRLARAALGYGDASAVWGEEPVLAALLEEALDTAGPTPTPLRARVLARLAQALSRGGQRERWDALMEEAVNVARQAGDVAALAAVLEARQALGGPDDLDRRFAEAAEIIELAESIGHWELALRGRGWRSVGLLERGEIGEFRRMVDEHERLARRLDLPLHIRDAVGWRAVLAVLAGRFEDASRLIDETRRLSDEAGDPGELGIYIAMANTLALLRRHPSDLEALAAFSEENFDMQIPAAKVGSAVLLFLVGRVVEARARLDDVLGAGLDAIRKDLLWLATLAQLGELCAMLDDRDHAQEVVGILAPYRDRIVAVDRAFGFRGAIAHSLGLVHLHFGSFEEAEAAFDVALARHSQLESPPLLAMTQAAYARLLDERGAPGDAERAADLRDEATSTARALGMELAL